MPLFFFFAQVPDQTSQVESQNDSDVGALAVLQRETGTKGRGGEGEEEPDL